ncbi:hypothetical protein sscle_11g086240 [Sclerotinia sclerotiorum 1980 UF-70]|uniref:Uncharacterized protein n=1 Tax=Sclerotinia sclerotiorum (strain ATCC 18683 / 1980 / Ss-1) TaxID=665079 RepID=A0A1D9QFY5_SCLS1|nr:hypothetical protein sscle_11g086240 [Sclerotinia sclerotiorum 1980 UF-70]
MSRTIEIHVTRIYRSSSRSSHYYSSSISRSRSTSRHKDTARRERHHTSPSPHAFSPHSSSSSPSPAPPLRLIRHPDSGRRKLEVDISISCNNPTERYTYSPCSTFAPAPRHYGSGGYRNVGSAGAGRYEEYYYYTPTPSVPIATSNTVRVFVNDGSCEERRGRDARVYCKRRDDGGRRYCYQSAHERERSRGRSREKNSGVRDRTPTPYYEDFIRSGPEWEKKSTRTRSRGERSRERERVVEYEYITRTPSPKPKPVVRQRESERVFEYMDRNRLEDDRARGRSREREKSTERVIYVRRRSPRPKSTSGSREREKGRGIDKDKHIDKAEGTGRTVYYVTRRKRESSGRERDSGKERCRLDSDEEDVERELRIRRRYSVNRLGVERGVRFRV